MTTTTVQPPTLLRTLIDERGIRHTFLAARAGITRSHFTRLLNRERAPTGAFVEVMSAQLGIEPSAFFDGRELLLANSQSPTNELSSADVQATERGQVVGRGDEARDRVHLQDAAASLLVPPGGQREGAGAE